MLHSEEQVHNEIYIFQNFFIKKIIQGNINWQGEWQLSESWHDDYVDFHSPYWQQSEFPNKLPNVLKITWRSQKKIPDNPKKVCDDPKEDAIVRQLFGDLMHIFRVPKWAERDNGGGWFQAI